MKTTRFVILTACIVSLAPLSSSWAQEEKKEGDRPTRREAPADANRPRPEADAPRRDGERRPMPFSEDERMKLREARAKALGEADVKAALEKKEAADREYFNVMKAAMLKADPSLASLFEKMDQMPGFRMMMLMPEIPGRGGPRPDGERPPGAERRPRDGERPAPEKADK